MKTFYVVLGLIVGGYCLSAIDPGGERAAFRACVEQRASWVITNGPGTLEEAVAIARVDCQNDR